MVENKYIHPDQAIAWLGPKTYMVDNRRDDMEYKVQLEPLSREFKTYVHGFLRDGFGTGCSKKLKFPVRIQTRKGEWGRPLMQIIGYNQDVGATIYEVYVGVIDLIVTPDVRHEGLDYFINSRPPI